jgi:hypothetical protein
MRLAKRMEAEDSSDGEYPFSGPVFVLTHELPDLPDPAVTFLTGDIVEAAATALDAAGGRNLDILHHDRGTPSCCDVWRSVHFVTMTLMSELPGELRFRKTWKVERAAQIEFGTLRSIEAVAGQSAVALPRRGGVS